MMEKDDLQNQDALLKNQQNGGSDSSQSDAGKTDNSIPTGHTSDEHNSSYPNYAECTNRELIDTMKRLLNEKPVNELKDEMEKIKTQFYTNHKNNVEQQKQAFIRRGGDPKDFVPEGNPLEDEFKQLYNDYKNKKNDLNKKLEKEKEENLKKCREVIEKIKQLINSEESINQTFDDFRALQKEWDEIGAVPPKEEKHIWNDYHTIVTKFYDYIKINKELRDLDLQKNLEAKNDLISKAEALLSEPSVVKAYKKLQDLHAKWKEIGPVPKKDRESIWEKFSEISRQINKKHQEYFIQLREEQKQNLEQKQALLEEANQINEKNLTTLQEWKDMSERMIDIQKQWRQIGPIPKKGNQDINWRFKNTCDEFFSKKRDFYAQNKALFEENIQQKKQLIEQIENLQDSEEWEKTTKEIIKLQKEWKNIGPVPGGENKKLFNRFKKAADTFFQRKKDHYAAMNANQTDNLKEKEQLIQEIKDYSVTNNTEEDLNKMKEFEERWAKIGFVPIKEKERIQKEYKDAVNQFYERLNLEDKQKELLTYKNKLNDLINKPKADLKLKSEREKLVAKMKKTDEDLTTLENNIGFFRKTQNAQNLINQVYDQIEEAKKQREIIEEKLKLIDEYI